MLPTPTPAPSELPTSPPTPSPVARDPEPQTRPHPIDRSPERRFVDLLRRQHGVATASQAVGKGLTRSRVDRLVKAGVIARVGYGLLQSETSGATFERCAMLACLSAKGAIASHHTAARLLIGPDYHTGQVFHVVARETMKPRRESSFPIAVVVHRTRNLPPSDRCKVGVIPATAPMRTLLDIAALGDDAETAQALHGFLEMRRLTVSRIEVGLAQATDQHHRGASALRAAVEAAVATGAAKTESPPERRLLELISTAGIEAPVPQLELRDHDGKPVARVDFAWPTERLILEMDGFRWHGGVRSFRSDRAKDRILATLGWQVMRVTPVDLVESPERVLDEIRGALVVRRSRGAKP